MVLSLEVFHVNILCHLVVLHKCIGPFMLIIHYYFENSVVAKYDSQQFSSVDKEDKRRIKDFQNYQK